MCNQIALGMEHLSNQRIIHRDIAARNILLNPLLDLKISNLGLCRDVYAAEYYPFHNQLIPLRWMPPEAVFEQEYSSKSDVWSFGVFCWEVFSLCDMPYKLQTDEEVLKGLKSGEFLLETASGTHLSMQQLIKNCLQEEPQLRPSFSEIVVSIGEMIIDSDV